MRARAARTAHRRVRRQPSVRCPEMSQEYRYPMGRRSSQNWVRGWDIARIYPVRPETCPGVDVTWRSALGTLNMRHSKPEHRTGTAGDGANGSSSPTTQRSQSDRALQASDEEAP